jgi:hypothetical protein
MIRTVRTEATENFEKMLKTFSKRFTKVGYQIQWMKMGRPRIIQRITPEGYEEHAEVIDYELKITDPAGQSYDKIVDFLNVKGKRVVGHIDYLQAEENSDEINGLVKQYGDVEIPVMFRTRQYCDHCNTNRRRNRTFIVVDEGGKFEQIGSTCVELYFGVSVPYLDIFRDFVVKYGDDEDMGWGGGGGIDGNKFTDLLELLTGFMLKYEYVGRQKANERGCMSTGDMMLNTIITARLRHGGEKARNKAQKLLDECREAAQSILSEISIIIDLKLDEFQDPEISSKMCNFEYTCLTMANADFVPNRYFNYIAGWICRIVSENTQRKKVAVFKHFPAEIGERIEFTAKVVSVKTFMNGYGESKLIIFHTEDNCKIKSFYSGREYYSEGSTVKVKASIVRQEEDEKWGKSTMVSRIKVVEVINEAQTQTA